MRTGQVVADRFQLGRVAGRGGMGIVFEADDRCTGKRVAVKILPASTETSDARRFEREASLLAKLVHPALVRYVAHGVAWDGRPYLAMEWLDGKPLSSRLADGPMAVGQCLDLGIAAAAGLAAAHATGIVHRDLKPSNVFLVDDADQPVRIIDFGVAAAPLARLTATGVVVGTPGYMSPEQARGEPVGPAADVFALGALLFECLTGQRALVGEASGIGPMVEPPRACELRPSIPEPLDQLLVSMLAADARQRLDLDGVRRQLAGIREQLGAGEAPLSRRAAALAERELRLSFAIRSRSASAASAEAIVELGRDWSASVESLTGGSWLIALAAEGPASDRAANAARCALAMRPLLDDVPMAIVMAPSATDAPSSRGQLHDRSAEVLASTRAGETRMDADVAALLLDRFVTDATAGPPRLLAELPDRDQPRRIAGGPAPYIGRDRQLASIEQTFSQAVARARAAVVLVEGPPGIGKSRLCHEALRRIGPRVDATRIWRARGDSRRTHAPFWLLHRLMATRADTAPAGPAPIDARAAHTHQGLAYERWLRAWQDAVVAAASAGPLLIVLEDAQWIDPQSRTAIEASARAADDLPLLLLSQSRAHPSDVDFGNAEVTRIALQGLSPRASTELARALLATVASEATRADERAVVRIVAEAAGSPLLLEELAGAARLGIEAPNTVLAMIQTEIESLDLEARRVLRLASVLPETFGRDQLERLLGGGHQLPQAAMRRTLQRLLSTQLLRRGATEMQLALRCDLVRRAARATLTDEDRVTAERLAAAR